MKQLGEHFKSDDRSRHSEWLRHSQWFIKARRDQERKEEVADRLDEDILSLVAEVVMATQIQITEFRARLNANHEATTAALMENQAKLEDIESRLAELDIHLANFFSHGNVMDDGRLVFLTADRTQAYDEFGEEVSEDEYDYGLFPTDHQPVDPFLNVLKERGELIQARKETLEAGQRIHDFEKLNDKALEASDSGKLTKIELEELSAELDDAMPPEVAKHLQGNISLSNAPNAKTSFAEHASPVNMTAPTTTNQSAPVYEPMG